MRPELVRDAGRDPMFIVDSSTTGVICLEPVREARRVVHQSAVRGLRRRGQFGGDADEPGIDRIGAIAPQHGRLDRCGNEGLEVLSGALGVGELGGDHLTLLGHPQADLHAAGRLGDDRVVARPAAAADGATPTVEQTQLHVVSSGDLDQALLTSIQRPVRCQVAAVLVAVGVPEHHLLQAATMIEPFDVSGVRPQRVDDVGGRLQVGDGLEQRDDADGQLRRARPTPRSNATGRPRGTARPLRARRTPIRTWR